MHFFRPIQVLKVRSRILALKSSKPAVLNALHTVLIPQNTETKEPQTFLSPASSTLWTSLFSISNSALFSSS